MEAEACTDVSEQQLAQTPQYQAPAGDPKATAKAAKAYAKAMRPWYKKKRFLVPIGFVAIVGMSSAATGGESGPTVTDTPAAAADVKAGDKKDVSSDANDAPAEQGSEASPAKIGQTGRARRAPATRSTVRGPPRPWAPRSCRRRRDGVFVDSST